MRTRYSPAAVAVTFVLTLLLFSCSAGQSEKGTGEEGAVQEGTGEGRVGEAGAEDTQAALTDDSSDLRAALVPIAHLTSAWENVSMDELSQASELAVPRELHESARGLLGRSDFEDFGSTDEVLDHVSRNPEAIGLVPWTEVDPRVKVLAVDGVSLLDPASAPESSTSRREGCSAAPTSRTSARRTRFWTT